MQTIVRAMLKSDTEAEVTWVTTVAPDENVNTVKETQKHSDAVDQLEYLSQSVNIILNIVRDVQLASGPLYCAFMRFDRREANV